MQVLDHPPDHELLLIVFLTETGQIGTDDLEELEHDGGHAAEMTGPAGTFEDVGEIAALRRMSSADRSGTSSAPWGRRRGRARGLAQLQVVFERPGIAVEVFARPELGRVDEDRDDREIGLAAAPLDQPGVALVQGAHRGDQPDALARDARAAATALRTAGRGLDELNHSTRSGASRRGADSRDCSGTHRGSAGRSRSRPARSSWPRSAAHRRS